MSLPRLFSRRLSSGAAPPGLGLSAPAVRAFTTKQPPQPTQPAQATDELLEQRLAVWNQRLAHVDGFPREAIDKILARARQSFTIGNVARSELYHNSLLLAPEDAACPDRIRTPRDFHALMSFINSDITTTHGVVPIGVSMALGKFLQTQARLMNARRVLEVGTLGGFSSLWLASGIAGRPGARVTTLELMPKHAAVAQSNYDLAIRLGASVAPIEVRQGPALDSLRAMPTPTRDDEAFDLIFVDANHEDLVGYYQEAKRLGRSGTAVVRISRIREKAKALGRRLSIFYMFISSMTYLY